MWDLPSAIICDDVAKDPSDCLSPLTSAKSYFSESRYSARYVPASIPWPMTGTTIYVPVIVSYTIHCWPLYSHAIEMNQQYFRLNC